MNRIKQLYGHSLSLLTDLYQLTMAYGYWKTGRLDHEAIFHLFFRTAPFKGSYVIAAGLGSVLEYLEDLSFTESDLTYLALLESDDGQSLFEQAFLDYLSELRFTCHIDAIPEGTLVFPHEPLLRVRGSLLQCQLLETSLLNLINFQSLIATKASRICQATQGAPVLEFGLRRAQGIDGALSASRAAYIGGCAGTSNVLAGKLYGIPVRGTHAHSWVMAFANELEAFEKYAEVMPNNCLFLVDTYDTLRGVQKAIQVGHHLREHGNELIGIRLDSGDLIGLSQQARKLLNEAGFPKTCIVASNDLDEYSVTELKQAGAQIDTWGIGTHLVTSYDQPALGGVYKLSAIRVPGQAWQYRLKLSEQSIKISTPGELQIRRFSNANGKFTGDMLYNQQQPLEEITQAVNFYNEQQRHSVLSNAIYQDLLVPVVRQGIPVFESPLLSDIRERTRDQLFRCPESVKRLINSEPYPLSMERNLYELKQSLIQQAQSAD